MGIATGTLPYGLPNNTGPFTATKGPSGIGTYRDPGSRNLEQNLHNPTNHSPKRKSFLRGTAEDMIKTLSRVLCGSMVGDLINGMLKDGQFSLNGIVHSNFIEGFGSRLFADFSGAFSERLFNGETTILGIPIPKLPAELSSQILSNSWVHLWRFYTNNYSLTNVSAKTDQSPEVKRFREYMADKPWVGMLKKAEEQFKKNILPPLEKFLSVFFGVKGAVLIKDANGNPIKDPLTGKDKEIPPTVQWWKLAPLTIGSFIATAFLPKDTQQFGFNGIFNAAGGAKSIFRFFTSIGAALLGRFESTYFRNVLSMNRNGFSPEACHKATVREKMLLPLAQYFVDGISALSTRSLQKFIPINGATLSLILRFPFELVANLLSSSLLGIASKHRVPPQWEYLGFKYWKPLAKCLEMVFKPFLWIINPLYRLVLRGILPNETELAKHGLKYRPYDKENAGDSAIAKFKNNTAWDDFKLFIRSANPWKLFKDMKNVVHEANTLSKKHHADVRATLDPAQRATLNKKSDSSWFGGVSPAYNGGVGYSPTSSSVKSTDKSDATDTAQSTDRSADGGVVTAVVLPRHHDVSLVDAGVSSDSGGGFFSFAGDGGGGYSGDGGGGGDGGG